MIMKILIYDAVNFIGNTGIETLDLMDKTMTQWLKKIMIFFIQARLHTHLQVKV